MLRTNLNDTIFSGKAGKEMGCIDIGRGIQIPIFAKYCSKLCYYDGNEARQAEIIYCPHNGSRHDEVDRAFQREMLRKNPTTTTTTERIIENPDMTIGLSTLIAPDDENQLNSRNQVLGLRPVAFGRFDRPQRRRTTRRPNLFIPSNRSPRTQNTQLDKTIHQLIQEGFFDSPNNFPQATAKSTERSSILQTSTSSPFTTPSLSTKGIENTDFEEGIEKNEETNVLDDDKTKNQGPPLADASLLLELNEPEYSDIEEVEGSADWSVKTDSTITSQ